MDADQESLNRTSELIIGCAFRVINTLGAGFPEKAYENALAHEMRGAGLSVTQQHKISVYYDGVVVGDDAVDFPVENSVMVELKAVKMLDSIHTAQCMNYLKATNLRLCLLLNFGKSRLEIQRVVNGL
ncbi:MAG TPA: GxxExxY protein [Acetobacteraceae bacterium]|jgi:GxxExxY protein|nr:GxxExxY protein [Acetobacteraceae bacterium]